MVTGWCTQQQKAGGDNHPMLGIYTSNHEILDETTESIVWHSPQTIFPDHTDTSQNRMSSPRHTQRSHQPACVLMSTQKFGRCKWHFAPEYNREVGTIKEAGLVAHGFIPHSTRIMQQHVATPSPITETLIRRHQSPSPREADR